MSDPTQSSYHAASMPIGLDKELERLRNQALISWDKEARNLKLFGLEPDMNVLELGSGPGFVTEQLVGLVPGGQVTSVEIDPELISRAESYLRNAGVERWRIIQGNVMSTGLPDSVFDFAYGRFLFQHLPDPVGAAQEVLRVLKPGGILVIFDVDDATNIFEPRGGPDIQAIDERIASHSREAQASKGGNRLVGRWLLHILKTAGFAGFDIEALVLHSALVDLNTLAPKPSRESLRPLLDEGVITEEELAMLVAEGERFEQSDYVIMLIALMARGQKPSG